MFMAQLVGKNSYGLESVRYCFLIIRNIDKGNVNTCGSSIYSRSGWNYNSRESVKILEIV
jgi:hypothetical protein